MDWFPGDFLWVFACTGEDDGQVRKVRNGYGTNMSFRREIFTKCGRFDTSLGARGGGRQGKSELIGEDTELAMRIRRLTGMSVVYNPKVEVTHRAYQYRLKRPFLMRRAYWEGYTKAIFQRRRDDNNSATAQLDPERTLLKRILFRLIPSYLAGALRLSARDWKRLDVTLTILTAVSIGYVRGRIQPLSTPEKLLCTG